VSASPTGTIRETTSRPTTSEQVHNTLPSLLVRTAEMRDEYAAGLDGATALHADVQQLSLDGRTRSLETAGTAELLERLAGDEGFSWATMARCLGLSATALRKWRRGEMASPHNHQRLARLAAFTELVHELQPRIDDVPFWLEAPVNEATSLTRVDLYRLNKHSELLDLATERSDALTVLDLVAPDWRRNYRHDGRFEVVWHDDGTNSIVMREPDD